MEIILCVFKFKSLKRHVMWWKCVETPLCVFYKPSLGIFSASESGQEAFMEQEIPHLH